MKKEQIYKKQSKLGKLIREKGMTQKEFAELLYRKHRYFIALTNLSNYCSGLKSIKKIDTAMMFADVLEVDILDIL